MRTMAQLEAEQAAAVAKLKKQHAVAACLPVAPDYVDASSAMGWPLATYKVEGLRGALEMLKRFTVVPFTEFRNGFLRLQPMQFVPVEQRDKHAAQWALSIDVSTHFLSHCGAGTTVRVKFFARVEGLDVVNVWLDVKGPGYIGSFNALGATCKTRNTGNFGHGTAVVPGSARPNAPLSGAADRVQAWGTGGDDWANHSYLVHTDLEGQDTPGAELKHAVEVLTNLSTEFDAKGTI